MSLFLNFKKFLSWLPESSHWKLLAPPGNLYITLKSQNLSAALVREGFLKILEEPPKKNQQKKRGQNGKKTEKVGPIPKRGGGVPLSQPKKTQKMVNFHEKINCSEWSKMQNKHWNFFSVFFGPNHGEGGGSAGWSKRPTFSVFFLWLPLEKWKQMNNSVMTLNLDLSFIYCLTKHC